RWNSALGPGAWRSPLAQRGYEVHGIEASEAMVEQLRAKAGGDDIPVSIGDFAGLDIQGKFSLVYVVFNTFFALISKEDQVRCFSNVAGRLREGGVFVIEAFVPDMTRWDWSWRIETSYVGDDSVVLDAARHDPVEQRVASTHLVVSRAGVKMYPVLLRYAWPSELDLMVRLARLRLRGRWGGWRREPFAASSIKHVSVYERLKCPLVDG
ncbi:MAG TPA: class I SAM-dependent methyltransferase, partial [Rubrobacter sp.]|nr:class I SAM-dependent methyltransferase [Rubrobacter sp.]